MPSNPSLTLSPPALDEAIAHFERHEGVVLHPYLDTKGLVTIGVGFLCQEKSDFVALPLMHRASEEPATAEEKGATWEKLCQAAKDKQNLLRRAEEWQEYSNLVVPLPWVRTRLAQEIQERAAKVARTIGAEAWCALAPRQKIVAIDLHYANGSLRGFPSFVRAVQAGDASQMARESLYHSGRKSDGSLRRNWGRIVSNYALCQNLDPTAASQRQKVAGQVATLFATRGEAEELPEWLRLLVSARKANSNQKSAKNSEKSGENCPI